MEVTVDGKPVAAWETDRNGTHRTIPRVSIHNPSFPAFISRWVLAVPQHVLQYVYEAHVPAPWGDAGKVTLWWVIYHGVPALGALHHEVTNKREYRWACFARNGQIVGASTEGYRKLRSCLANARLFGAPIPPMVPGAHIPLIGVRKLKKFARTWVFVPLAESLLEYYELKP